MACDMQQYIVRNLKFYCLYFKQRKCRIFYDVRFVKIIESLIEENYLCVCYSDNVRSFQNLYVCICMCVCVCVSERVLL